MVKRFKAFNESKNDIESKKNIRYICYQHDIKNYTINDDGTIDVDGDVHLSNKGLTSLPLKFRNVSGDFDCSDNQLKTLEGSPQSVGGYFDCEHNQLVNLEGSPISVGGYFTCSNNKLITLKGAPKSVDTFYCGNNKLSTLEYISDFKNLFCVGNPIHRWWYMVKYKSEANQELFIDFNIHCDDPDDINEEKINMINNN